ncbi:MAG: ABC transporter ATP-binding protein [Acidimicrobiia bacterium]
MTGKPPSVEQTRLRTPEVRRGLGLLLRTLSRYKRDSVRSIAGALLWMALVVTIPLLVGGAIDRIRDGDRSALTPLIVFIIVGGAVQAVGIGARRYFGFRLSYRAEADLRNRMFAHIQQLTFSFHDRTSTGQLMARASSDLSQVRLIFAMLPITLANIGMFLLVVSVLIVIDPVLGSVAGLTIPILFYSANRFARRVIDLSFSVQERLADLSEVVEEAVAGVQVVKAYGQERQERRRLDDAAGRIFENTTALARQSAAFSPLFELIPSAGTVAVLWLGGIRVVDGAVSLGEFVAFLQYLAVLVLPIRITGWFFANLPRAAAAASRVDELLETVPDVMAHDGAARLAPGPGEVVFEDVSFEYEDGPGVLDDVSLRIAGGSSVALVGATGSGKTTFAHLIPRFRDPATGRVLVDGVDVRDLMLDDLRNEVAVVFQETFLFSASLRENIALGAPEATDEEVRAAARLAQAHGFICELPEAYETVVGERGLSLSGGQRQRVALARAVLRDPRVLILDDATSSVDAVVEAEIQAALRRVMEGRTTIVIAHRTSTLALVDEVVFLEDGEVVAIGPHEQLLATVPRYAEVLAAGEDLGERDEPGVPA